MPPAGPEKGGASHAPGDGNKGPEGKPKSSFRNDARMKALYEAFKQGDRAKMEEVISDRSENARLHRKLKGKGCSWTELKEDVVYRVSNSAGEVVVVKVFEKDEFPFHEICGNVVGTALLSVAGPFFVRALDVGRSTDSGQWLIVMEHLDADAEELDLDEPVVMYQLLYQAAHALHHLQQAANLQHFDLRYDNIMVKVLPQPRDLFKDGLPASFIVKIGDWGQCEFDFGTERPPNPDVPREEEYNRKWGNYPEQYSGYDVQYLLGTLTPVLQSLHGLEHYYIYTMALDFLQPCSFTQAQDRPVVVTSKLPLDVLRFLKKQVAPTLA